MTKNHSVGVDGTSSSSKVLDALKSRYSCSSEPSLANNNDRTRYFRSLWVFGNREVDHHDQQQSPLSQSLSKLMVDLNYIDPLIIKEKIVTALTNLSLREPHVLVQFWSPVTVRKRCLLMTLDQPFGLGVVDDEGLYLYRLESEQRVIVVDGEHREELGPPGRVYRQKLPEWSFDVYTIPRRQCGQDWAACYNIHGYIILPIFEPDSGCCVGVLELITSSNYVDYAFEVREVSRALKEENLMSLNMLEDPRLYVADERSRHDLAEIFKVLKAVCDIQNIPLAQTWALSRNRSSVVNSGKLEQSCSSFKKSCIGKFCMSTADLPFYVRDLSMWAFHEACREKHLEKSRGVVGRSLSSCSTWFCRDVTELDEDDYPLLPFARMSGITSCLAIYLKSIERDVEYVIELVWTPHSANEADLQSLVKTVKQQIMNAPRVQLGIMSSLQVIGGVPLNWNIESNSVSELPQELENFVYVPSNSVSVGTSHNVPYIIEEGITHRKRKRSKSSISLEEIEKHFGKPVDEAAAILNVCRSTLKRIYKNIGIPDRKYKDRSVGLEEISNHYGETAKEPEDIIRACRSMSKRILSNHGTPKLNGPDERLGTTNLTYAPATITEHGKHSSTLVYQQEQTNLSETTMREQFIENKAVTTVKNLTIEVTYKESMAKFPFMLSDGLVKLEELVAARLQLGIGKFSLKYVDEDGDLILITCDVALMELMSEFRQPDDDQTVIRLLVWPVANA